MYKLLKDTLSNKQYGVLRIADNSFIPFVEANKDYQEYLKWVAEGNTPTPADE
jgi:hypothetical protein